MPWGELAIKEIHLILQCNVKHAKEMPEIGAYSALFCRGPTSTVWIQFVPLKQFTVRVRIQNYIQTYPAHCKHTCGDWPYTAASAFCHWRSQHYSSPLSPSLITGKNLRCCSLLQLCTEGTYFCYTSHIWTSTASVLSKTGKSLEKYNLKTYVSRFSLKIPTQQWQHRLRCSAGAAQLRARFSQVQ